MTESILDKLGVKDLSKENAEKYYSMVIYGRYGTGKTTVLTRNNDALVLDINEGGTTVASDGSAVDIQNYQHLRMVIENLPALINELRESGKEINVVVIETAQKLRDITMDDIMKGKNKRPTFNDYGEAANRIVGMTRFIKKMQKKLKFHFAITGHETTTDEKDDEGALINAMVTLDALRAIRDAILSESDVVARTLIEVQEVEGQKQINYILSAEPSPLYVTKIRHAPDVTISNKRFENASVEMIADAIRNGN